MTPTQPDIFLFISGAGGCVRVPELLQALVAESFHVYSVLAPDVEW